MKTYPLDVMNLQEASYAQFRLVDIISQHFPGREFLNLGTLGIEGSQHVKKVERVFSEFFQAEDAILLREAGTGALRWGLYSILEPGGTLLVHKAPIYPTTRTSIAMMGLQLVFANFNQRNELIDVLRTKKINAVLIQYTRQIMEDSYQMADVIALIKKEQAHLPILSDDNYAVCRVPSLSVASGADLSAFSLFKLLGPEGLACLLGRHSLIQKVRLQQYSGGSLVQSFEAMESLRSLVYVPVSLALSAQVLDELIALLNGGLLPFVKKAFIANAQSRVALVEFKEDIAQDLLKETEELGALSAPVGAESRYEILPLFYRISATFLEHDAHLAYRMIRINPNRAGTQTIIHILRQAYQRMISHRAQKESDATQCPQKE